MAFSMCPLAHQEPIQKRLDFYGIDALADAKTALQMVLRLLAANAGTLARHRLNAYLRDLNEYWAPARHLLQLGGTPTASPCAATGPTTTPRSSERLPCSPTQPYPHPRRPLLITTP
ncbi:MAG: hypothetical protein ACRDTC_20900 [Pseudonocardiaceae bacterium]